LPGEDLNHSDAQQLWALLLPPIRRQDRDTGVLESLTLSSFFSKLNDYFPPHAFPALVMLPTSAEIEPIIRTLQISMAAALLTGLLSSANVSDAHKWEAAAAGSVTPTGAMSVPAGRSHGDEMGVVSTSAAWIYQA
jgi:hypothetical protein